jgi:hypothetical protein
VTEGGGESVVTNGFYATGWRGRHWNALEYPGGVFATGLTGGRRPINTAYLPTVDSVVENIVSQLQQREHQQVHKAVVLRVWNSFGRRVVLISWENRAISSSPIFLFMLIF